MIAQILADCSQNRQSAKINSPPKFPAIRYIVFLLKYCVQYCARCAVICIIALCLKVRTICTVVRVLVMVELRTFHCLFVVKLLLRAVT